MLKKISWSRNKIAQQLYWARSSLTRVKSPEVYMFLMAKCLTKSTLKIKQQKTACVTNTCKFLSQFQNWNCVSGAYPRASRLASMALFISGDPQLKIGHFSQKRISYFWNFFTILCCIEQNLPEYQMQARGYEFGSFPGYKSYTTIPYLQGYTSLSAFYILLNSIKCQRSAMEKKRDDG